MPKALRPSNANCDHYGPYVMSAKDASQNAACIQVFVDPSSCKELNMMSLTNNLLENIYTFFLLFHTLNVGLLRHNSFSLA